mmetsp:Transcript_126962/g.359275  ORF Transcript_126962/g.359275 Transcript_126962/m.359275 type:complete len:328 (+) Transcript_126962:675-1658(+)
MRAGALRDAVQRRTLPGRAHDRRLGLPHEERRRRRGLAEPADREADRDAEPARQRADQGHHPVRHRRCVRPLHLPAPDEPHPHGPDREVVPDHHPQLPALLLGEPEEPAPALRHPEHHRAGHHGPVRPEHPAGPLRQPPLRAVAPGVAEPEVDAADVRSRHLQHQRLPRALPEVRHARQGLPGSQHFGAHLDARAAHQAPDQHRLHEGGLHRLAQGHAPGRLRGAAPGEQDAASAKADVRVEHAAAVLEVLHQGLRGADVRIRAAPRGGGRHSRGRGDAEKPAEAPLAGREEQGGEEEEALRAAAHEEGEGEAARAGPAIPAAGGGG